MITTKTLRFSCEYIYTHVFARAGVAGVLSSVRIHDLYYVSSTFVGKNGHQTVPTCPWNRFIYLRNSLAKNV